MALLVRTLYVDDDEDDDNEVGLLWWLDRTKAPYGGVRKKGTRFSVDEEN